MGLVLAELAEKEKTIKEKGMESELAVTGNNLKEYISAVLDLETQKRTLQITEWFLADKKRKLATTSKVVPPQRQSVRVERSADNVDGALGKLGYAILGVIAVVFLFRGILFMEISSLVFGFLLAAAGVWGFFHTGAKQDQEYEELVAAAEREAERQYQQDYVEYQKKLGMEQQAAEQQIAAIDPDLETIHQIREKTETLLDQFYGLDIIHQSYRNIVPIASFAHYLSTGICNELEGPNGCYRLYESEALQKVIITKLDQVIDRLDELNERQYELKKALLDSNAKVERLTGFVRGVADENRQHHAVMQYNQECIREEIQRQNEYTRMKDWLDS